MIQNFKSYGFKTIRVNGFNVFTCNIIIDRINELPDIEGVSITNSSKLLKSGANKDTTKFCYTTADYHLHQKLRREVMLFMEQHALNKVAAKYSYLHTEVAAQEDISSPTIWDELDF
jgi:tRNA A37 N6-isopentenylltransferase MiaA